MRFDRLLMGVLVTGLAVAVVYTRMASQRSPAGRSARSQPAVQNVVVYTSMDQPVAAEVFKRIEKQCGVHIVPQYDAEASKTTGLVNKIRGERAVPQADIFWSNEPYQMEQLGREGLLAAYNSTAGWDLPEGVRPNNRLWTPMTLKPRVVVFKPGDSRHLIHVYEEDFTVLDYWTQVGLHKEDKGRWVISNPQFGTTRGQFAALAAAGGPQAYRRWLQELANNAVRIVDGNSVAAEQVARKAADFAWTDLDDCLAVRAGGVEVGLYIPPGRPILTPATVALIAHGPNPEAAKKVFDVLVSAKAEEWMARSEMRLVPIRPELREKLMAEKPALWPAEVQAVDWTAFPNVPKIVDAMPQAMQMAKEVLLHE